MWGDREIIKGDQGFAVTDNFRLQKGKIAERRVVP